jgi:hypothetical protein
MWKREVFRPGLESQLCDSRVKSKMPKCYLLEV